MHSRTQTTAESCPYAPQCLAEVIGNQPDQAIFHYRSLYHKYPAPPLILGLRSQS